MKANPRPWSLLQAHSVPLSSTSNITCVCHPPKLFNLSPDPTGARAFSRGNPDPTSHLPFSSPYPALSFPDWAPR